jgi:hypothetical protein
MGGRNVARGYCRAGGDRCGRVFPKGDTRYFQEGALNGAAGSIRYLMCNNGWIVLDDHVLVIDANMPGRAEAVERTGATVIARAGMMEELRRYETGAFGGAPGRWEQVSKLRPDVAATPVMAPTQMFERSDVLNGTSGREVELLHPGLGHTRGDAVAWLPKERILFTGDLVTMVPLTSFVIPRWHHGSTRFPPCRR